MPDTPSPLDTTRKATDTAADALNKAGDAARDRLERTTDASRDIGAQTVNALSEAGKQASSAIEDVTKAARDAYEKSVSDYQTLSQKWFNVRSYQDLIELQGAALQTAQDNLGAASAIYRLYWTSVTRSFQPVADNAAAAGQRWRETASAA